MSRRDPIEVYEQFLQFIREENLAEHGRLRRRVWEIFFWCLIAPVGVVVIVWLLSPFHLIPVDRRAVYEWVMTIFPVGYSVYFFFRRVAWGAPGHIREGSIGMALRGALEESRWRKDVVDRLQKKLALAPEELRWIHKAFARDLKQLHRKSRHLIVVGAVIFFLMMQGLDLLSGGPTLEDFLSPGGVHILAFAVFSVLLYLSESETQRSLERYGDCVGFLID